MPESRAKLRVAFLLFYFEGWDAFEGSFRAMQRHPRFEPFVVAIPRKLTGYERWGDLKKVTRFLDERGLVAGKDYFALDGKMGASAAAEGDTGERAGERERKIEGERDYDGWAALDQLKRLAPDYIFLNYPWMRNYPPGLQLENLQWSRVCYLPYFALPLVNEPGVEGVGPHMFTQPVHQFARLVFTPDAAVTEALSATDRGERGVVFTGSPKLDEAVTRARGLSREDARWPIASDPARLRVVWAPHHSYHEGWLNFGNFAETYKKMLKFATKRQDIDFVLRPHPFLFSTMTSRGVIAKDKLKRWRKAWKALPNTATEKRGDFVELFVASDLLVTDGISFLAEYPLTTGRPALFLERAGHWPLSPLGEVARDANITITRFGEFKRAVVALSRGEALASREAEIAELAAAALPYPGETAERILDAVIEDWG